MKVKQLLILGKVKLRCSEQSLKKADIIANKALSIITIITIITAVTSK